MAPTPRTTTVRQQTLEARIITYLEENNRRNEDSNRRIEGKIDDLAEKMTHHVNSEGHELTNRRVKSVEDEQQRFRERPLKTWQVVAGIIGLFFSFCFLALDVLSFVLSIYTFVRVIR